VHNAHYSRRCEIKTLILLKTWLILYGYSNLLRSYLQLPSALYLLKGAGAGGFFSTKTCLIGKTITPCTIVQISRISLILFYLKEENILQVGSKPDFQNYNFKR